MEALGHTLSTFGVDAKVTAAPPWPHGHDVRGRGRLGHEGQQGAEPLERHRVCARDPRRPHHRPDPGQVGDRHRGAEPPSRLRDARRHPAFEGREAGDPSAHSGPRQGHPRRGADGEPGDDAARADRGGDRRRQVEPGEQLHHVDPDAHEPGRRPARPRRPQTGGAQSLRRRAAPAESGDRAPEAGHRGPRVDRARDGVALRDARDGRRARHRRVRGGPARGDAAPAGRPRARVRST